MVKNYNLWTNEIRQTYNICTDPVPIWQIEEIIIDHGYDIVVSKTITKSCVLEKCLIMPCTVDSKYRYLLSHELGHILLHEFQTPTIDKIVLRKRELQADTFAFFFLIPQNSFMQAAKSMDLYELAELYGVPIKTVENGFKLMQ